MLRLTLVIFGCLLLSSLQGAQEKDTVIRRIEQIPSVRKQAAAYNDAAERAWRTGEYIAARMYADKGLVIAEKNGYVSLESKLLNNRGVAFDCLDQTAQALRDFFAALKIQDKLDDPKTKGDILGNIGLIYMNQDSNEKAMSYHRRALKLRKSVNDLHGVSASLNNIAIVYTQMDEYLRAIEIYRECIRIDEQTQDLRGLGDDYNNIGIAYMDIGDFARCLEYLEKSVAIRSDLGFEMGVAECYSNFGTMYKKQGDYDRAREYFLKSIAIAEKYNDIGALSYCYQHLTENEEAAGDSLAAYRYYRMYMDAYEQLNNSELVSRQTALEMNYEFDKEREVEALRQKEKERQYTIVIVAVSAGMILILLFSVLFYRKWKQTLRQRTIIAENNALLRQKNEEILDSINYARRIQHAIIPSDEAVQQSFADYFIIYRPKDIVSGDFYWLDRQDGLTYFAVADCTGHGVPGALMSVVCHNALNRSLREFGLRRPADILNQTRKLVIEELSKSDTSVADGMDISLCVFGEGNVLQWAGANHRLWVWRRDSGAIEEWKGDKQPIGNYSRMQLFTQHTVELRKGDRVYLFTDGITDQFGGLDNRKFLSRQLREILGKTAAPPLHEQQEELLTRLLEWKGTQEQTDDICVVGLQL